MVYYVNTPYNQPVYSTPVYMAGPAGNCARAPLMPTQFGQTGAVDPVNPPPAPTPPGPNGTPAAASPDIWKMIMTSSWTWILLALFIIMLFILMKSPRNYY